jgi:protein phosphatase
MGWRRARSRRRAVATAAASDTGRMRQRNEDAFGEFERDDGARLLVVADGMGGHAGGEVASRIAVEAIGAVFLREAEAAPEAGLRLGFAEANAHIHHVAEDTPGLFGMGTTATAVWLAADGSGVAAHVGDSRVYRLRGSRLACLTADHSWVAEELRAGRLDPAEAPVHPLRHALLRALGVDREVEVDVAALALRPGDRLLLCSDGLWGELPEDAIGRELARGAPERCARALVDAANRAGGRDNITVLVAVLPK